MAENTDETQISEAVLVVMAQTRDATAFRKLMDLYQGRLSYYIRRQIGPTDESDDVLQETWLRVHRRIHTLRAPEAFRVWLYKIAHDLSVGHIRKSTRTAQTASDESFDQNVIDTWDEYEAMEHADLVHQTLESLSPEHREVLTLRFLEQMDIEEMAVVVDCATGTVKSRLHYAKAALRKQIEEQLNG